MDACSTWGHWTSSGQVVFRVAVVCRVFDVYDIASHRGGKCFTLLSQPGKASAFWYHKEGYSGRKVVVSIFASFFLRFYLEIAKLKKRPLMESRSTLLEEKSPLFLQTASSQSIHRLTTIYFRNTFNPSDEKTFKYHHNHMAAVWKQVVGSIKKENSRFQRTVSRSRPREIRNVMTRKCFEVHSTTMMNWIIWS